MEVMAPRYLEVTVRLDFGTGLTEEERNEVAESVALDIDYDARNGSLTTNHECLDWNISTKWADEGEGL
jgi:hypothetical protein